MRQILFLLLIMLLISCGTIKNKEQITEFQIFGYSGFLLKDSADNHYSYDYYFDSDSFFQFKIDSTQLDIRRYFEYKKDSMIKVAVRGYRGKTKFYLIPQFDTAPLEKIVNRLLLNDSLKSEYHDPSRMYDGYSYTLHFRTTKNKEFDFNYIPKDLPDSLRILHDFIEKIIEGDRKQIINKFEYDPITSSIAKKLFINHPPPPLPRSNRNIKFVHPEIKPD